MKNSLVLKKAIPHFLLVLVILAGNPLQAQNEIPTPESYFGFQMGADRKLARWDRIVDYFYELEKLSGKIKVINMGPSAEGHPFLVTIISSEDNIRNLDKYQRINKLISDPRGVEETELEQFIDEGKAVICQSMSLHASEVGGTQMAPELAYDLLTRQDSETQRILGNVIFVMIPCLNPDGQIMITDWYRETVGTEYEGISMPWLYHKYSGHDNNRDGDYHNLVESKYMAKTIFVDWLPQAYIDHHHMGSSGARFFVPPYCDPIRPYADPLVWREISWYGAHIAYKLEEQGFKGVLNAAQFAGWGHFGWHWITPFHNIAGMLTESAGVNYATPIYIHPEQLSGGGRAFPEYAAQSTFPNPWPGGWWHLRDIVEQKKSSAWSLLDLAARNKETVLRTACLKAQNQTQRGAEGDIKTVIIPADQHDPLTARKMINTLLRSGIEIHKANNPFVVDGMQYPKGSWLISLAQPKMGLIRNLLCETHYADNSWTRQEDGTPIYPYDLATHTMYEFMGVQVDALEKQVTGDFPLLSSPEEFSGVLIQGQAGYVLDGRQNLSYLAVNRLLNEGIVVKRVDEAQGELKAGDFFIPLGNESQLITIAEETGVDFNPLRAMPSGKTHQVKRGRLALFQRYFGGNMDEGWTRLCFENYGFDYHSLMFDEINKGNLVKKYDVIILPDDSPEAIKGASLSRGADISAYPEKYRSTLSKEGLQALKDFVSQGGTIVTFGDSWEFAAELFDLKVRNVTSNLDSKEFFCPGSTLKVDIDPADPLAYGMPDEGLVLFRSSPVFSISAGLDNPDYKTIVRYQDQNLLKSGWLIGEKQIVKKPAMVSVKKGEGQIVLIGFRPQHRNQTDGTFKLVFNAIIR